MQQAVDAFLDLDEGAVVGQVANNTSDHGVRSDTARRPCPRDWADLLHAQGDFLLLLADVEDLHLDVVADVDQFAGVIEASRPRHLGDVNKPSTPGSSLTNAP